MTTPQLWAIIVTYHRPVELERMLTAVSQQSKRPDHIVIVDNGQDPTVQVIAQEAGATYMDAGDNLGPAGGVAWAMEHILTVADEADWVLSLDDDDPPPANDLIEAVWSYGLSRLEADPLTAGAGCYGAAYEPRRGTFRRYMDHELVGDMQVSVVGGPFLPMYRCSVIRRIGTFDKALFFGFEEGEFGLRLNQAGYRLYVRGDLARRTRALLWDSEKIPAEPRTTTTKAAWRRYYSVRNSTLLAWRYASPIAPAYVAVGGGIKSAFTLLRMRRPLTEVLLPLRGAVEGLLQRTGRTINPSSSYK